MTHDTYGATASRVREAMRILGIPTADALKVYELARVAVNSGASTTDVWAVAALIVDDCTKLPALDAGWTPAWPDRVTDAQTEGVRRLMARVLA